MPVSNVEVDVLLEEREWLDSMADEVRQGLHAAPKTLPSKYFYDARGSELFERITELPEYYQTRTEQAMLEGLREELVSAVAPLDLIELGSGSAKKTRLLIDSALSSGRLERYIPLEVSQAIARRTAEQLAGDYPELEIHAVVGDFEQHLDQIPPGKRRLVVFLGGTIGNFDRPEALEFLRNVSGLLDPESRFLLGTDLVKDTDVLEAAYNDRQGVTAEFNRNILRVVNRHLRGDFDPSAFEHVAFYNDAQDRIEMHLRSREAQTVKLREIDLEVPFDDGEMMRTEVSCKYTRSSAEQILGDAGLQLEHWHTDPKNYFALSLSRPE